MLARNNAKTAVFVGPRGLPPPATARKQPVSRPRGMSRLQQNETGRLQAAPRNTSSASGAEAAFSQIMGDASSAAARKRSSSGNPGGVSPASGAEASVFQAPHAAPQPPPASVPVDEVDELLLGVGLGLLVNPADVGSHGAFGHAQGIKSLDNDQGGRKPYASRKAWPDWVGGRAAPRQARAAAGRT